MERGGNIKKWLIAGLITLILCGCSQALDGSFNEAELFQAATDVLESELWGNYRKRESGFTNHIEWRHSLNQPEFH